MVSRIKKGMKNLRDKTTDALYKLYTPQEHHPKAKIFQKEQFKPGDMTIRFKQRKKPKRVLSVEEIMEKEEAKIEAKKKAKKKSKEAKKKSKKRRRGYRKKTRKGKKQFLKKMKKSKKGGRRRKRRRKRKTRKRKGGQGEKVPSLKTLAAKVIAENIDLKDREKWESIGEAGKQVLHQASLRASIIKKGDPTIGSILRRKKDGKLFKVINETEKKEKREAMGWGFGGRNAQMETTYPIVKRIDLKATDSSEEIKGIKIDEWFFEFMWILHGINLKGADLKKGRLLFMDFKDADLEEANLRGAYIRNCNFKNANLKKVNFKSINNQEEREDTFIFDNNFEEADVTDAIYDNETHFKGNVELNKDVMNRKSGNSL